MRKRGVYGSELMKKSHYWPRGVHRNGINKYVRSEDIGYMGCLSGEWDDADFNVFVLKDRNFNITTMSKISYLNVSDGQKGERRMVNEEVVKFKYPEVFSIH